MKILHDSDKGRRRECGWSRQVTDLIKQPFVDDWSQIWSFQELHGISGICFNDCLRACCESDGVIFFLCQVSTAIRKCFKKKRYVLNKHWRVVFLLLMFTSSNTMETKLLPTLKIQGAKISRDGIPYVTETFHIELKIWSMKCKQATQILKHAVSNYTLHLDTSVVFFTYMFCLFRALC